MAQPNYALIRYQADNIPQFDGNPKLINRFISSCENFLNAHRDRNNANAAINVALFDTVLSKLIGRAADLIASRIELNSWELIRNAIISTFSDQRSVDCVIQDIITMKPDKNENPQQFGLRLQDIRSLLFSKINSSNEAREIKLLKIAEYGNLVTKTFISGLNYHMQLVVRLKNPQSLEEAISHAIEEGNFLYFKNRQNTSSKIQASSQNTLTPQNKHFRPTQNNYTTQPTQRNFVPFQQNVSYTPMMPQYFNTHRNDFPQRNNLQFAGFGQFRPRSGQSRMINNTNQNFQRSPTNQLRSNVFKSQNRQLPRDEPMDVSSGNTIINRAMNQQNQNRNFTSQELYNQSVTSLKDQTEENFEPYVENSYPEEENAYIPINNQFDDVNHSNDDFCCENYQFEQPGNFDESNFQISHSSNPPI